jgi:hypothetical protein
MRALQCESKGAIVCAKGSGCSGLSDTCAVCVGGSDRDRSIRVVTVTHRHTGRKTHTTRTHSHTHTHTPTPPADTHRVPIGTACPSTPPSHTRSTIIPASTIHVCRDPLPHRSSTRRVARRCVARPSHTPRRYRHNIDRLRHTSNTPNPALLSTAGGPFSELPHSLLVSVGKKVLDGQENIIFNNLALPCPPWLTIAPVTSRVEEGRVDVSGRGRVRAIGGGRRASQTRYQCRVPILYYPLATSS